MNVQASLIEIVAKGWFSFCYFFSLLFLPFFPFVTTGFDWKIALAIIFGCPVLFLVQGLLIGAMVWLGLQIYQVFGRLIGGGSR
ncbi:hypothetical protein [Microbulbifer magnicolonia]|uniref:hypothetical protein n=1 Tax=Microbulbifer magnicolonia TaxID=3109744 RepID=UPI002B4005EB|nr:hypothetical protein [Microbulbifer sp. GG15]